MSTSAIDHKLADRLRALFKSMRRAKQKQIANMDFESVRRFLSDFAALRGVPKVSQHGPIMGPVINPERLSQFIERFKTLLQVARTGGALIDLWEVAGLGRDELRTAAVLAWLLDPRESHGREARIFASFVQEVQRRNDKKLIPEKLLSSNYLVMTEAYAIGDSANRVDILVEGSEFVVIIEVKIDAAEGDNQIARYVEVAASKAAVLGTDHYAVVFLAPNSHGKVGRQPRNLLIATWADVAAAINRNIAAEQVDGGRAAWILKQFANRIRHF